MSEPVTKDLSWKLLGWILDVIALSALAFSISLHTRINELELWRAETTGNRYTSVNRIQDQKQDSLEKQELWKALNAMQSQWLKDITSIKESLASISTELKYVPKSGRRDTTDRDE